MHTLIDSMADSDIKFNPLTTVVLAFELVYYDSRGFYVRLRTHI